jgi:serine/threonine-protein kinase RsbW
VEPGRESPPVRETRNVNVPGPIVDLQLESRPETLTIVRGMLSGVAELLEMDAELLDDLKTATSEACNNVVLHAYGARTGPMQIRVFADAGELRIVVDDRGTGPGVVGAWSADGFAEGIGVSVIGALAREATFSGRSGGGTEVAMSFAAVRDGRRLFAAPQAAAGGDIGEMPLHENELGMTLSPVSLLTGVLGRLARTLAAAAHFSLDRFSDVYLVTDALAAHAADAVAGERIVAHLSAAERRLELVLGPFAPGTGAALSATGADPLSSPLAMLADEVSVIDGVDEESLRVVVVDHRR